MKQREHNNVWCDIYSDKVLPDEMRNCSLCGARLHDLTPDEARRLIDLFEDLALERTRKDRWHAEDWLFDDEAGALAIAKETAVSGTR